MKNLIRRLIHSVGYDLHRLNVSSRPEFQLRKSLDKFHIDLVFDIGANKGQFASELRSVGYGGRIVSFEPLPDAYQVLTRNAKLDRTWEVHKRCAVGDYDGEVEINVSGNSVSSSILPMMEAHSSAAIGSAYVNSEQVSISRLDSVVSDYASENNRIFVKIDTQGFEWQVLDGARETLKHAQGVLCELSLVPLYEGQRLWKDILQRLENDGFTLWAIQRGFTDPRDGRSLQINAIFFRADV